MASGDTSLAPCEFMVRDARRQNERGRDETGHLDPLDEIAASGRPQAERWLARYHGPWAGSVEPALFIAMARQVTASKVQDDWLSGATLRTSR